MKKTILVSIALLSVFSASAVVGHNGSDGELSITSSGSSSASQAVGPNGTEWSSNFTWRPTRNNDTGINNHEFSNLTLNFSGIMETSTPCYDIESNISEVGENSYKFNIKSVPKAGPDEEVACAQVISFREYNGSITDDHPFKVEILHDGEVIENLEHPNYHEGHGEDEVKEKSGMFKGLRNWFNSLF